MRHEKSVRKTFKRVCVGICLAALLAAGAGCGMNGDVAFARRVFKQLVDGRYAARHAIDWERLVALDKPVGQLYSAYEGEADRLGFQRAFIESFRDGFRAQGSRFTDFTNWRVLDTDEAKSLTRVAANAKKHPEMFLLLSIETRGRKRQLTEISAQKVINEERFKEYERQARQGS